MKIFAFRFLLLFAIMLSSMQVLLSQDMILDSTYTTADNLLTFDHPSEWIFHDGDEGIVAYTDRDESDVTIEIELYEDTTPEEMMALSTDLGDPIEVTEMVLGDRDVTLVIMALFRGQRDYRYTVNLGGGTFASLWFIDRNGIYEDVQGTLEAMVASIRSGDSSGNVDTGTSADDGEIVYDTIVSSFSKSFTITIPSSLFEFSATERTPDNITLTNNWDIFQDGGGIRMNKGDVLLIYDYYESAAAFDLPLDATVEDVADTLVSRSRLAYSEPSPVTLGDYDGYVYIASGSDLLIYASGVFDVGDGAFVSFLLLTASFEDAANLDMVAYHIVETFEKGLKFDRVGAIGLELPETYTRDDGFTIPYPDGWEVDVSIVGETEFVTVTKGQTFDMSNPPVEGEPIAIVAYGTVTELTGLPMTMLSPNTNAMRVIQYIIGAAPDEIVELEVKGYQAAQVVSASEVFESWFVAIMLDDNHFVAVNMFTAVDADEDFFGTVIEMMTEARWGELASGESDAETTDATDDATGSLPSIDLPETFVSANNGLTYHYPAGWIAYDVSPELSALINTQDAFDELTQQLPPQSGQVLITIFTHTTMDALGGTDDEMRMTILNSTAFTEGVGELAETQINGQTVYIAEGALDDADKIVVFIQVGEHYELISALTASDEMDDFRDTILAIALTMAVE